LLATIFLEMYIRCIVFRIDTSHNIIALHLL